MIWLKFYFEFLVNKIIFTLTNLFYTPNLNLPTFQNSTEKNEHDHPYPQPRNLKESQTGKSREIHEKESQRFHKETLKDLERYVRYPNQEV